MTMRNLIDTLKPLGKGTTAKAKAPKLTLAKAKAGGSPSKAAAAAKSVLAAKAATAPKDARRTKVSKRYVVTYNQASDPPLEEVVELKRGLKGVTVLDEMPGTVLVQGAPADVRKAVEPLQHWTFSPEGHFST